MRTLTVAALCTLFSVPVLAGKKQAAKKPAAVADSRPANGTSENGTLRAIELHSTVQVAAAAGDTASGSPDTEHGPVSAEVKTRDSSAPLSNGALSELAERQMRKNLASIETCALEETLRSPQANGTLNLAVSVSERKVGSLRVVDDSLKSAALEECLNKAARSWTFSLKTAEFTWPITISPRHR